MYTPPGIILPPAIDEFLFQILTLVIEQRKRIIDETDARDDDDALLDDEDLGSATALKLNGPSSDAIAKITDYCESEMS